MKSPLNDIYIPNDIKPVGEKTLVYLCQGRLHEGKVIAEKFVYTGDFLLTYHEAKFNLHTPSGVGHTPEEAVSRYCQRLVWQRQRLATQLSELNVAMQAAETFRGIYVYNTEEALEKE